MNGTVKITGGIPLKGTVSPISNKNSILAALPACILTDEDLIYHKVPRSTDVEKMLEMLKMLGAKIDDSDYDNLKINCVNLNSYKVDAELGNQIRAAIMFAGPLLARFGIAEIPVPGGCVLGKRSIAAHVDVFQKAGVSVEYLGNYVRFTRPKNLKSEYFIWQTEASVTATENLALYASGINSTITLVDAASEPHVTDLLQLLQLMGANTEGVGSNILKITGKEKLSGESFTPDLDIVDIAGYIVAAAVTDGEITIKGAGNEMLTGGITQWFSKFNIFLESKNGDLVVKRNGDLEIDLKNSGFPMAGSTMPKLHPRPWPGFPADIIPVMATLASKTKGRLLLGNWMYESGLDFVRELNAMGAEIFISDPQRVIISGPVQFKGGEIYSPGIIQACKAIFLAALCDNVTTTIHGVDILKRR